MSSTVKRERRPVLFVFREWKPGDDRKAAADSNDAQTGGGARDLRFNHKSMGAALGRLFPDPSFVTRRRGGKKQEVTVQNGHIVYPVDPHDPYGKTERVPVAYEPPTSARPSEGRIAMIHKVPSLAAPPPRDGGRIFVVLVLDDQGDVRAHYVTAKSLKENSRWDKMVVKTILECMTATPEREAAQGYIDFASGDTYCHSHRKP